MMHALIMDVCASSSIESESLAVSSSVLAVSSIEPTILITTQHYNTSNIIDLV